MAATRQRLDVFGVVVLGVIAAIAGTALYALLIRTSVNASLAWWISVAGVFALRAYALHRDWTIATIGPRNTPDESGSTERREALEPDGSCSRSWTLERAVHG